MVKEATHGRLPDLLKPFFAIDAESLDQFADLLRREGGRVVYGVLDIESQPYQGFREFTIVLDSKTGERALRLKEGQRQRIYDLTDYHFLIRAVLTGEDRLSRLADSIPGIVTRLSIKGQDGLGEIDMDVLRRETEKFDLKPFPMPEAASQESR